MKKFNTKTTGLILMVHYHNAHDQLEVVRNRGAQNQLWKRATGLLSFLADEPGAESASCVESLADFLF